MTMLALIADYARSRKNTARVMLGELYDARVQAYLWSPRNRRRVREKILRLLSEERDAIPLLMTNIDGVQSEDAQRPLQEEAIALTKGRLFSVVGSCSSEVWPSVEALQRKHPAVCTPLAIHLPYVLDETTEHYRQRIREAFLSLPEGHPFHIARGNDAKHPAAQDASHR